MGTPPAPVDFDSADYPELGDADRLVRPLNLFTDAAVNLLDGNLSFEDNFNAAIKDVRLVMPNTPPWVTPTLTNSWVAYGAGTSTPGYYIAPGGRVYLKGHVKDGSALATSIFTLPTGFRPDADYTFANNSASAFGALLVRANGQVIPQAGVTTAFSMDGVHFIATAPMAAPSAFTWNETPYVAHGLEKCVGVQVLAASMKGQTVSESVGAFTLDWKDTGDGRIKVNAAWGLQWGQTYTLKLLMVGG